MGPIAAIRRCFAAYVTFSGRASRPEFWYFALFVWLGLAVLGAIDIALTGTVETGPGGFVAETDTPILSGLFGLLTCLPALSVLVRRLHDTDRSGWWYWILLIPLIGPIVLLVFLASRGTPAPNRFGPAPGTATEVG
ncbi:DUF805 domain-containing protein [Acidimangrovimonas sediminis]|uniref:DUF805 domain-containing protein n=1 Tax=Acidimangrovimonas sediminis TaxID=2056283 RepID=UPI000C80578B|nr:DUF805 domain-containing protein [Acidimangrovimonas sediminis]